MAIDPKTTNTPPTPAPATPRGPKPAIAADPFEVIGAAREAAAKGQGTHAAIALLLANYPGKYDGIDAEWFGARMTYYRRNPDFAPLVPTFGGIGTARDSAAAVAKAILEAEAKKHGKPLLPPQPARDITGHKKGGGTYGPSTSMPPPAEHLRVAPEPTAADKALAEAAVKGAAQAEAAKGGKK